CLFQAEEGRRYWSVTGVQACALPICYQSISEARADIAQLASDAAQFPAETSAMRGRLPLIGRDAEKAELLRRLDEAMAGHGAIVLLAREAGFGKTRLGGEIFAGAGRRGFLTLTRSGYGMERAPPYGPFVELVENCARVAPRNSFLQAIGEAAPEVARLVPELRRVFPHIASPVDLPPEQQRRYLFNAYCEFVERACRVSPMAVVIEDLH